MTNNNPNNDDDDEFEDFDPCEDFLKRIGDEESLQFQLMTIIAVIKKYGYTELTLLNDLMGCISKMVELVFDALGDEKAKEAFLGLDNDLFSVLTVVDEYLVS